MRWVNKFSLRERIRPSAMRAGDANGTQIEIVGIVPYTQSSLFEKDSNGTLYLPFSGGFQSNVFFHIKFSPTAGRDARAAAESHSPHRA